MHINLEACVKSKTWLGGILLKWQNKQEYYNNENIANFSLCAHLISSNEQNLEHVIHIWPHDSHTREILGNICQTVLKLLIGKLKRNEQKKNHGSIFCHIIRWKQINLLTNKFSVDFHEESTQKCFHRVFFLLFCFYLFVRSCIVLFHI